MEEQVADSLELPVHCMLRVQGHHPTFGDGPEREAYSAQATLASQQLVLPFSVPGEEAFLRRRA